MENPLKLEGHNFHVWHYLMELDDSKAYWNTPKMIYILFLGSIINEH
jgi:hypothetical protein